MGGKRLRGKGERGTSPSPVSLGKRAKGEGEARRYIEKLHDFIELIRPRPSPLARKILFGTGLNLGKTQKKTLGDNIASSNGLLKRSGFGRRDGAAVDDRLLLR